MWMRERASTFRNSAILVQDHAMRLFAIPLTLCAAALAWQAPPARVPASVRATAEATASAPPDRARIRVGVITQAAVAQDAAAANARQLDTVLAALRKTVGANGSIQTASYSVVPNYRYPREAGQPTITGYTATNFVEVTVDDLSRLPRIIDSAAQLGANAVQSLQFLLRDEQPLRARALRDATAAARADAEAMASAAGLRIVRVLSIEESAPQPIRPMREMAAMAAPASATPIEPGVVEVRAVVTFTAAVE
jgi:uncharacterized protein YggE